MANRFADDLPDCFADAAPIVSADGQPEPSSNHRSIAAADADADVSRAFASSVPSAHNQTDVCAN